MDGGNYIKEGRDSAKSTCLIFSPREDDEVGSLGRYLKLFAVSRCNDQLSILFFRNELNIDYYFQKHKINLLHIESRSSAREANSYEFMVECAPGGDMGSVIETLRDQCGYFSIISRWVIGADAVDQWSRELSLS